MREIKFRGKSLYTGKWLYGSLVVGTNGDAEIYPEGEFIPCETPLEWCVDPKTVGQFTGMYDKNGREIYEGDIVLNPPNNIYLIVWCNGGFVGLLNGVHGNDIESHMLCAYEWAVIGNIHDNPELLNNIKTKGGVL